MESESDLPTKDDMDHPVPEAWRPKLRAVVQALAEGDYSLSRGIAGVVSPTEVEAKRLEDAVAAFGETLTELPEETWDGSVCQWIDPHWEVFLDLWTLEGGRSDLILSVWVFESSLSLRFEVQAACVP